MFILPFFPGPPTFPKRYLRVAEIPVACRDHAAIIDDDPDLRQVSRIIFHLYLALPTSDQRREDITPVMDTEERDPGAPELAPLEGQEARPKGSDVNDLSPRSIPAQISPGSQRRSAEGFVNRIVVSADFQMKPILELGQGQGCMLFTVIVALLDD